MDFAEDRRGTTINNQPVIIDRPDHCISRARISDSALKVLYRLKNAGCGAYLVGGSVRDLLLGQEPKDFDVATDAEPEEVRKLFRNSRLIGRRFRLVHVQFGREIIEVATFRALHDADPGESDGDVALDDSGRILRDNVYGTQEEDALRRDFTVNALFYDIRDFSVVDYVGGMEDLQRGVLRLIGDPVTRYREDPVRMLRAVRFAVKLGFRIDRDTEAPLFELGHLLRDIPPARLFDEILKLFMNGTGVQCFELLRHYGLFAHLFPETERELAHEEEGFPITFVARALGNTDKRVADDKPVTPAFVFAALLWEPVRRRTTELVESGRSEAEAVRIAGEEVAARARDTVAIPKRFATPMKEIFQFQFRLRRRRGKRTLRTLGHPRFRAAYDFFCLRAEVGEEDPELAEWWTEIQKLPPEAQRKRILDGGGPGKKKKKGRRRRSGGRRRDGQGSPE